MFRGERNVLSNTFSNRHKVVIKRNNSRICYKCISNVDTHRRGDAEERRYIKDLTPSQTLPIFFWLSLKNLWKKLLLLNLHREAILFRYFLKLASRRDLRSGSFSFRKHLRRWSLLIIEVRIPLVIQGWLDFSFF